MSNAIAVIPFNRDLTPEQIKAVQAAFAVGGADDEFSEGIRSAFAVLSIRGKKWTVVAGGEQTIIADPNDPDEPARKIEVVALRAAPGLSKTYYAGPYDPDNTGTPDCYSNDGVRPARDATSPQAQTCQNCPQNVWGSKINELGHAVKACGDSKRLAVAALGNLDNPMLLVVPPMSFEGLKKYHGWLKNHGLPMYGMVAQLGFDKSVDYPKITWTPAGLVPPEMAAEVLAARDSQATKEMVNGTAGSTSDAPPMERVDEAPAQAVAPKAAQPVKPAAAPKAAAPKAAQPVKPAAAPKAAAPKPAPAAEDPNDILAGMDALLEANNFPKVDTPAEPAGDEAAQFPTF